MFTQKRLAALTLGLFLTAPAMAANKVSFAFTTIDVPGAAATDANGNSTNAIAGDYTDSGGVTHGYMLRGGTFKAIDVPSGVFTSVNGINAPGQITGTYVDAGGRVHCFFSNDGSSFTTLTPPGSIRCQGGFINALGEAVGTYRDANNKRHGFTWRNGAFANLFINVPGDDPVLGTVAVSILRQSRRLY
jgi:hypothetical protein